MILGALIDAGIRLEDVRDALGSLAIAPDTVWTEPVVRAGIRATKFNVRGEVAPADSHLMTITTHANTHTPLRNRTDTRQVNRTDTHQIRLDMNRGRTDIRQDRTASYADRDFRPHRSLCVERSGEGPDETPLHDPGRGRSRRFMAFRWSACISTRSGRSIRSSTSRARCSRSSSWVSTGSLVTAQRRRWDDSLRSRPLPGAGACNDAPAEGSAGVFGNGASRAGDADGRAAHHGVRKRVRAASRHASESDWIRRGDT